VTNTTNSEAINALNDSRTTLISAGIEYSKGAGTLTALASISDESFTGRGDASEALGLASATDFHSFTLAYSRQINGNLSVNGSVGLVGVTSGFSLALPRTLLPIYSVGAVWALTPKLLLNVSASKSISPPTTVIANSQTSETAAVSLTYQLTPKVSVSASGSVGNSDSSFTSATPEISPFFVNTQKTYALSAGLNYSMTPFLSAALNASYNERVSTGLITPQDIVTVSLNYAPY
jgi:hypothetical protein